jgi:hypothetical protein
MLAIGSSQERVNKCSGKVVRIMPLYVNVQLYCRCSTYGSFSASRDVISAVTEFMVRPPWALGLRQLFSFAWRHQRGDKSPWFDHRGRSAYGSPSASRDVIRAVAEFMVRPLLALVSAGLTSRNVTAAVQRCYCCCCCSKMAPACSEEHKAIEMRDVTSPLLGVSPAFAK